jgi:DNA mismatch repair protein MutL
MQEAATPTMDGATSDSAPRIRPLDPLLVNQIAAGEVVERPASVVKELVENAIDAGATRIAIDLASGGIDLVRVTDDGAGIAPADLPLAVGPHATSKIAHATDLERIATMGFRGEALASIASVSRLTIRSRRPEDDGASEISVEGGAAHPVKPTSGPVGTSVHVRNLFFNTPARRKFLRTAQTEQTRCVDAVRSLAAANPRIGFRVSADERTLLDLPPDQSPRARALEILGRELDSRFLEAHADQFDDARGIALWGLVGLPDIARATNRAQHIFLNGRPIRDKTIQHALREAYRGLIEPSRHPTAVLMLETAPDAVDVNVHPTKWEVRFRDTSLLHSVVLRAVRDALRAADLTTTGLLRPLPGTLRGSEAIQPSGSIDAARFVEYFRRDVPASTGGRLDYDRLRAALDPIRSESHHAATDEPPAHADQSPPDASHVPGFLSPRPARRILQVHKSYIVTEDEHGVLIVDQHALHERVMFEVLLERVTAGNLESQRLLTPAIVQATESHLAALDSLAPLLTRLGIQAEPIGPTSIAIHAFPTLLFDRKVDPVEFLAELLDHAETDAFNPDSEEALRDVLDMMSCKAAVKAGDALAEHELSNLLDLRDQIERSSNCPHGRPTSIRLTIDQLDKLFHRS